MVNKNDFEEDDENFVHDIGDTKVAHRKRFYSTSVLETKAELRRLKYSMMADPAPFMCRTTGKRVMFNAAHLFARNDSKKDSKGVPLVPARSTSLLPSSEAERIATALRNFETENGNDIMMPRRVSASGKIQTTDES